MNPNGILEVEIISPHKFKYKWSINNYQKPISLMSETIRRTIINYSLYFECCINSNDILRVYLHLRPINRIKKKSISNTLTDLQIISRCMDKNQTEIKHQRTSCVSYSQEHKLEILEVFIYTEKSSGYLLLKSLLAEGFSIEVIIKESTTTTENAQQHFSNAEERLVLPPEKTLTSTNQTSESEVVSNSYYEAAAYESNPYQSQYVDLIQDLERFFREGIMSDITILVEGKTIQSHKLILARSPVFRMMMEQDCQESKSNQISIDDCQFQTFKKFLKYLYTAEMMETEFGVIIDLYALADKYDVPGLFTICSQFMESILDSDKSDDPINSVCKILRLAHEHNDEELKAFAVQFICANYTEVAETSDWNELLLQDTILSSHVLIEVGNSFKNK